MFSSFDGTSVRLLFVFDVLCARRVYANEFASSSLVALCRRAKVATYDAHVASLFAARRNRVSRHLHARCCNCVVRLCLLSRLLGVNQRDNVRRVQVVALSSHRSSCRLVCRKAAPTCKSFVQQLAQKRCRVSRSGARHNCSILSQQR